jgi:hypothetical protein
MNSAQDTLAGGLPHSEIPGSPIARISPGLFAACHVLHRLSVPRHPPDALASRLITGILSGLREDAASPPAHRAKTLLPAFSRDAGPRESGGPCRMAASHEDTSSDRPDTSIPASKPVRLGHITTLSLFTLQPARAFAGLPAAAFLTSAPSLARTAFGVASGASYAGRRSFASLRGCRNACRVVATGLRPWCLAVQLGCTCRPAKHRFAGGGGERIRTDDLLLAKQALSQLSYTPISGVRSQGSGARKSRPLAPDP